MDPSGWSAPSLVARDQENLPANRLEAGRQEGALGAGVARWDRGEDDLARQGQRQAFLDQGLACPAPLVVRSMTRQLAEARSSLFDLRSETMFDQRGSLACESWIVAFSPVVQAQF